MPKDWRKTKVTSIFKKGKKVLKPKELAIIHCKVDEKGQGEVIQGHRKTNLAAKKVALQEYVAGALILCELNMDPP